MKKQMIGLFGLAILMSTVSCSSQKVVASFDEPIATEENLDTEENDVSDEKKIALEDLKNAIDARRRSLI